MAAGKENLETDLIDMASRFSARSGGGLSPELSANLALQIVLNEIAEKACRATGATGAAIALWREGEMVCCATSGSTAPELGSRLDTSSGLSGECFQTRRAQYCRDVTADPRADLGASTRLGVHSMMVLPLLSGADLVGLFALLSSRTAVFDERDQLTLEPFTQRALHGIEQAATLAASAPVQVLGHHADDEALPVLREEVTEPAEYSPTDDLGTTPPERAISVLTWVVGLTVIFGGVWMGARVAQHLFWPKTAVNARSVPAVGGTKDVSSTQQRSSPIVASTSGSTTPTPSSTATSRKTSHAAQPPIAGGLVVYDGGREVFRMVPSTGRDVRNPNESEPRASSQGTALQSAASVEADRGADYSPSSDHAILLRSVTPDYPEAARQQQIQGPVVLDVRIGRDGTVLALQRISGNALLAQAAADAVKQWQFKPFLVNGHPEETQTRVTLNFRLPE